MERMESQPSREALTGTPMTGRGVIEAMTPGRWAAMPAAAMMTLMPLSRAPLANFSTSSGVRSAEGRSFRRGCRNRRAVSPLVHDGKVGGASHDDAYFRFHSVQCSMFSVSVLSLHELRTN